MKVKTAIRILIGAIVSLSVVSSGAEVLKPADIRDIRLKGYVADRMDGCVRRHVAATDAMYLADVFRHHTETDRWQTEFWGKWMHSAAPFWTYTQCPRLRVAMDESASAVLAAQQDDGYIGNYPAGRRSGGGWDVWGNKYTMLGLLHHHAATGSADSLRGAERLADYLMGVFGPGKKSIAESGNFRGMPSCSVLEPIVWLYRATGSARYLEFARYIVSEMDADDGARLLKDADVPVARRVTDGTVRGSAIKSYEMMSCCQGLLDFFDATGETRCLDAARKTAESIRTTEVNLAGGASSSEQWYGGARRQVFPHVFQQETCVQTTWMRLAGKLLRETGDPVWADELEKTFYNAYLASLSADNAAFTQYCPLTGTRSKGAYHCRMHTNCCNANGPRGFLAFLENMLVSDGDRVCMNFYASGSQAVRFADGTRAEFETFTLYPADGRVEIRNRTPGRRRFALALRIPGWCASANVAVNGAPAGDAPAGAYLDIVREWKPGDKVEIDFDMSVKVHAIDNYVAFTSGPVLLARDRRFGDGDFSEALRRSILSCKIVKMESVAPEKGMWMTFAGVIPLGSHADNPEMGRPRMVRFCDYASAGDTWSQESFYRVWLPVEHGGPASF